jgi:hypothetical protein
LTFEIASTFSAACLSFSSFSAFSAFSFASATGSFVFSVTAAWFFVAAFTSRFAAPMPWWPFSASFSASLSFAVSTRSFASRRSPRLAVVLDVENSVLFETLFSDSSSSSCSIDITSRRCFACSHVSKSYSASSVGSFGFGTRGFFAAS